MNLQIQEPSVGWQSGRVENITFKSRAVTSLTLRSSIVLGVTTCFLAYVRFAPVHRMSALLLKADFSQRVRCGSGNLCNQFL